MSVESLLIERLDHREELKEVRGKPMEQLKWVSLKEEDPSKVIQIGMMLMPYLQNRLLEFL